MGVAERRTWWVFFVKIMKQIRERQGRKKLGKFSRSEQTRRRKKSAFRSLFVCLDIVLSVTLSDDESVFKI